MTHDSCPSLALLLSSTLPVSLLAIGSYFPYVSLKTIYLRLLRALAASGIHWSLISERCANPITVLRGKRSEAAKRTRRVGKHGKTVWQLSHTHVRLLKGFDGSFQKVGFMQEIGLLPSCINWRVMYKDRRKCWMCWSLVIDKSELCL